jgi:hypothetical protein
VSTTKTVLHAKLHNGLFEVQGSLANNKALLTKDILHKRYGHPGEKAQQKVDAEGKVMPLESVRSVSKPSSRR